MLGILALLVQCLVVAVHQPAQAAPAWPFQDPAAWCGAIGGDSGPELPDQTGPKAPLHHGVFCPICTSLQAAGPGLLPVLVAFVAPLLAPQLAVSVAAATAAPERFGHSAANPRAPPVSL